MYNKEGEEVGSDRERRNRNSRLSVNHINGVNMEEYHRQMSVLTDDRELRIQLCNVVRQPDDEIGSQLQKMRLSLGGSRRARAEKLYRACMRTVAIPGVPWYPTVDVAGEEH